MLRIKEMYFLKNSSKTGIMSIKMVGGKEDEYELFINEILFDADNTIEPVSFYAKNGSQLLSGSYFDLLKRQLHRIFKDAITDGEIGLYKYHNKKVEKV